jgi:tetratricopeptide (TPR) repeat protein
MDTSFGMMSVTASFPLYYVSIGGGTSSMTNDPGLTNAVLYNPRQLNRETLKAVFTARRGLLDRLIQDLRAKRPTHHLIVGPRGMGKTTLLRRIGIGIEEDDKLSKRLLPLTFPEEQYNVGSLGEFYLNCLDALADYFDKHEDPNSARKLDAIVHELRQLPEEKLLEDAETTLVQQAKSKKRQFVLLVDNLSIVIDRLSDKEKWRLREWLSRSEQRPVLIAATVKFISDTADYGQALYEFLQVHELTGCSTDEATALMLELAKVFNAPQVERWLKSDPARLAVLNRLAGGAPRTLVMLFQLIVQGMDGPIFQELESILDMATPLYKARFEELPDQAQRVVDALALHWDPATRLELEHEVRIEGNAISSQLSRLAKMGVVEEVSIPGEAKSAYQIAERFFNIWYLMRASRRSRYQLRWLVEFLKAFYSIDEREKLAHSLLSAHQCEHFSHGKRLLALSQAVENRHLQRELENSALYSFAKADRQHRADIGLSDINCDWLKTLDKLAAVSEKEQYILQGIEVQPDSVRYVALGVLYNQESHQYLKAEEAYQTAVRLDPKNSWGWIGLGFLWSQKLDRPAEAEQAFRTAIDVDKKNAIAWICLGRLLSERLDKFAEAEQVFRTAVEVAPKDAISWMLLGRLLADRFGNYLEAEQCFRKAIEINPKDVNSWFFLAGLLYCNLKRIPEAEQTFRKIIELDPTHSIAKECLAIHLYGHRLNNHEAESLARDAFDTNPTPENTHTLACILAANGKLEDSLHMFESYVGSVTNELNASELRNIQIYFSELVRRNQEALGIQLLKRLDLGNAWRPLLEALRAAEKRDCGMLKRINPEQREAAEETFDFFMEELSKETQGKLMHDRKSASH